LSVIVRLPVARNSRLLRNPVGMYIVSPTALGAGDCVCHSDG